MDLGDKVNNLSRKLKDNTVDYNPNPMRQEDNKQRALYGAAGVGVAYLIPGAHPVLELAAIGYAAVKGYQAVRDWAGK